MFLIAPGRPAFREAPGLGQEPAGRPRWRAGEAGPSRQRTGRGRQVLLGQAPGGASTATHVVHESGGTEERPIRGPAMARCLLQHVMVHRARSDIRRKTSFSAFNWPAASARDCTAVQRSCSHASERGPEAIVVLRGMSSPPLHRHVLHKCRDKRPHDSVPAHHCFRL